MAQHDYVIANASGASVRADINNMALAISSNNSGSSEPSTKYAYLWWLDSSANVLKLRNSANNAWITMPFSITANNTVDINGGAIDGTNIGASVAGSGAFTTLIGTALDISGNIDVDGITNLDVVDIDGALTQDGGAVFNEASADVDFRVESNSETHAFFINGAGEAVVGIGQISPTSPNDATDFLHIGSAQNQDTSIVLQDGVEIWEIYQNDNLNFCYDTSYVMTLERLTGRVGIGDTSPAALLTVKASANTYAGGFRIEGTDETTALGITHVNGDNYISGNATDDHIILKANGSVGIGATNSDLVTSLSGSVLPNKTLQVGYGQISSDHTSFNYNTNFTNNAYQSGNNATFSAITSRASGVIQLLENNFIFMNASSGTAGQAVSMVERIRVNSSGQLLLGTTSNNSDSYKMIVDCDSGSKGIDVRNVSYNSDNGAFRSVPPGNTSYRFAVMLNSSNSTVGKIEVTSANTTYTTSSDYRLKENITPLENGLDRLNQLKPVKFNWIESGQEEEGFIAHEVDEIFSDAVVGEKDAVQDNGTVSPQTMDYGRITPLLVKAIQEQQEQIEHLKTEIQTLKGE